jgi:hypothetical protein
MNKRECLFSRKENKLCKLIMTSDILLTTKRVRNYRSNMTYLQGSETLMHGIYFSQRELASPVSMPCTRVVQCYRLQGFIMGTKFAVTVHE